MIKYFAFALILVAGQSIASPVFDDHHGRSYHYTHHHASNWQIRRDAQRLINAGRLLLSSVRHYGSRYSHAAKDVRSLIRRAHSLKHATYSAHNRYLIRVKMRNIKAKYRHVRRVVTASHKLHHSRRIRLRLSRVGYKVHRLSRDIYGYNIRHYTH